MGRLMYTAKQIADKFGFSVQHVYYLRDQGVFIPVADPVRPKPQLFTAESVDSFSRGSGFHVLEERITTLESTVKKLENTIASLFT